MYERCMYVCMYVCMNVLKRKKNVKYFYKIIGQNLKDREHSDIKKNQRCLFYGVKMLESTKISHNRSRLNW